MENIMALEKKDPEQKLNKAVEMARKGLGAKT